MFKVLLLSTRATVRAVVSGNLSSGVKLGQVVIIGRPDSSGRSKGTGYVILGFAPETMRGTSGAPPIDIGERLGPPVPPTPPEPDPQYIWLGTEWDAKVRKYQTDSPAFLGSINLAGNGLTYARVLIAGDGCVYVFDAAKLLRIDAQTGAVTEIGSGYAAPNRERSGVLAFGAVWATDSTGKLWKINPTTGAVLGSIAAGGMKGLVADDDYLWATYSSGIRRINPSDLSYADFNLGMSTLTRLVDDDDHLYATNTAGSPNGSVVKVRKSDVTVVGQKTGYGDPWGITRVGPYLFSNDGALTIVKIDSGDMTELDRETAWNGGSFPSLASDDNSNVWMPGSVIGGGDNKRVKVFTAVHLTTVATLAADDATNPANMVYA
ncbi:MAG TPA: hypothetical protein VNL91_04195 [Thermoanaerobaculia bacterium]|nr:hypothetical protein [Thermoanaerobaculia bacterium]